MWVMLGHKWHNRGSSVDSDDADMLRVGITLIPTWSDTVLDLRSQNQQDDRRSFALLVALQTASNQL